jgi:hypothetical protein
MSLVYWKMSKQHSVVFAMDGYERPFSFSNLSCLYLAKKRSDEQSIKRKKYPLKSPQMSLHIFLKMPIAIIRKLVKKIANYALYIALAKTVGETKSDFFKDDKASHEIC